LIGPTTCPAYEGIAVIICHCAVVSDRLVTEAIAAGARSLAQVCTATNAGRDCGACVFNVKRVITEHRSSASCGVGEHRVERGDSRLSSESPVAKSA
jgi:bacterioferritin-associated ferredoxin